MEESGPGFMLDARGLHTAAPGGPRVEVEEDNLDEQHWMAMDGHLFTPLGGALQGQLGERESPVESLLHSLVPGCSAAVLERMRREGIHSLDDLAGLDKEDLRELGFTMVQRSRVLRWARQEPGVTSPPNLLPPPLRQVTGSNKSSSERLDELPETEEVLQRATTKRPTVPSSPSMIFCKESLLRRSSSHERSGLEEVIMHDGAVLRHLDEVERRADFWCQLVARSVGALQLRRQVEEVAAKLDAEGERADLTDLRENLLEKLFDLSPERLKEIYDSVDRDSDGRILKEELREALQRCEWHGMDSVLERVLEAVSTSDNKSIQLAEFQSMLTRLKLAELLGAPNAAGVGERLSILDYNSQGVKEQQDYTLRESREFFFGHRATDFPMRWVHLRGLNLTLLLALTVKYQLHPLSVEDVIDQSASRIDRYDVHYFAAIEHLCLVNGTTNHDGPVKVLGRHVTIFCAGPPHQDTVITITQPDRSFVQDWPGGVPTPNGVNDDPWVEKLRSRLKAKRSRVRERRSDFLMYEIIDLCVDELVRICRAYVARVNTLEGQLKTRTHMLQTESQKKEWFDEVLLIRLQLTVVLRRLRGLQRVLRRLAEDLDLSRTLFGYVQDVADHVHEAIEDATALGEKASSLTAAFDHAEDQEYTRQHHKQTLRQNEVDERLNKILFVLTIVTTIFTPVTFFAGIYGMNFQDANGRPTIPELLWPHGYFYFWIMIAVYFAASGLGSVYVWRRIMHNVDPNRADPGRSSIGSARAWGSDRV